jgi:putative ABC transport system permease protein
MQDLRLAVRALRTTPIVTAVAILSLALGIGANTAIFSLVNSLLLRTLPIVEPQRLVAISSGTAISQGNTPAWTYAVWDQIRQRTQMFDGALAWSQGLGSTTRFNLAQGGETEPVEGLFANGDFFTTLGVTALLGRTFTAADDVRGGGPDGPVAVISYGMWQRRFGGAATVVGTALVLERVPFTIIGVMSPEFFGTEVGRTFDVALPIGTEALIHGKDSAIDNGASYWLWIMVRLKPGQSLEAATATLRGVQPQIREAAMPQNVPPRAQELFLKEPFTLVQAAAGTSRLRQRYERPLVAILVIVALVLLIACANIANLLLARATARRHELSVRLALGASRWRLARQFLVESFVLAGIGAVLGLMIAAWGSRALVAALSTPVNRVSLNLSLDWRVMAFMAAVTVATAVLFGTAPAWRATRAAPIDALKEHARGASGDARVSLSSALVVAQVALSLVLVVAAGLFVRTLERLATLPLGFDADRVLTVTVDVTRAPIAPANRIPFDHQLVATVAAVPGVASAAGAMVTPVGGGGIIGEVDLPSAPPSAREPGPVPFWNSHSAMINQITPRWFATYGTTLRAGRDIDDRDTQNAPPVAVVNDAFARKFLPGRNPIGETVTFAPAGPVPRTIVGVVGDAVYISVRDGVRPTVYVPLAQRDFGPPATEINIGVRSSAGSSVQLAHSVAAALAAVDRNLTFSFRPLADQVDASLTQERVVAILSGLFGALALLLAGLGLYGVTSYSVTRRRTEIGIRMALGAEPAGVIRLVLSRVSVLIGLGVIVGAGVSLWASKFVATLLYGLEPRDPATLVGAAAILGAVGAFAGSLPAWRASRIDPAEVLREG